MISPTTSAPQAYNTQQPSFVQGTEARANTDQVQPRNAPAAESLRADPRELASRDEKRAQAKADDERRAERSEEPPARSEERRGSRVDITV